jgi:hypothetical protein
MNLSKKQQIIGISIAGILILGTAYYFLVYKRRYSEFPLKNGSSGNNVKLLQEKLGGLVVDGFFGNKTEQALISKTGKNTITKSELNAL